MPIYAFSCNNCDKKFEDLCRMGEFSSAKCPYCDSTDHKNLPSMFGFAFTNPIGTSKMDNFEYAAGHNLEKGKRMRRQAEQHNHMGPNVHADIDDISGGQYFGEVK